MCFSQGPQRSEAGETRTNKLGRGPLGDAKITKYQESMLSGIRQEVFKVFILKICFSLFDLDMQQTRTI